MVTDRRVGLALGGGGARGLAHIVILEVLEELGIRPQRIAGTSIGAIIGAVAASGAKVADMKSATKSLVHTDLGRLGEWFDDRQRPVHWLQLLSLEWGSGGLLNATRFMDELQRQFEFTTIEALPIPLSVVCTDFWSRQQVVFDRGDVITALRGSMAVPGIFVPVPFGDQLLIDGSTVNPVPFDLLFDDCDLTIAVDVLGAQSNPERRIPNVIESVLDTFQVMEQSLITHKLAIRRPDIYLRPAITDVRVLEFNKLDQIFAQTKPSCDELRQQLENLL